MASKFKKFLKKIVPVILIAAMIVQPQIALAVGESMGFSGAAASAAGAATIQTGAALAMGATPEQAIKAGAIAGVTAGVGSGVAAETGSNVIGGATGSAVGTAAAGGSSQDVLRNAAAGGVANGFADAGSASAGKAAGTLIATQGDVKAAATAAVTTELIQAGQQGYRDYSATKTAELDQMNNAFASAQPLVEAAKSQPGVQVAQADTGVVSDSAPMLTGVPGQTESGVIEVTATQEPTRGYDPNIAFTGSTQKPSSAPATTQTRDQQMIDLIKPTQSMDTTQPAPTAPETTPTEATPTGEKVAEKLGASKTPSPITYTGVTPLARTLNTSFGGYGSTTGITTGLAGERGAGEIEGKETGKERQNVWNEASLRLKDALGV